MSLDRRAFIRSLLLGSATVPVLGACGGGSGNAGSGRSETPAVPGTPSANPPSRSLRMMVIGDMGTGGKGQYQVSRAMEQVAREQGCDLVLATGDNLYEEGVTSVNDAGFLDKFEYPYQNLDMPFFLCLGNHDNACTPLGGGSDNRRGDYQVQYHYSPNRYSNKWHMPARYYSQTFDMSAGTPFVELFAVDSNPLTSFYRDLNRDFSWSEYGYPQQRWMKAQVAGSQAHWKIALSHVPYRSNGKHGNAGDLDRSLRWLFTSPDADGLRYRQFLEDCFADRADILFTGHDHVMQWLEPAPAMGRTHLMVSGAAGKTDSLRQADLNPAIYQHEKEYGFIWLELSERTMKVEFHIVSPVDGSHRLGFSRTQVKPIAQARPLEIA